MYLKRHYYQPIKEFNSQQDSKSTSSLHSAQQDHYSKTNLLRNQLQTKEVSLQAVQLDSSFIKAIQGRTNLYKEGLKRAYSLNQTSLKCFQVDNCSKDTAIADSSENAVIFEEVCNCSLFATISANPADYDQKNAH